MPVADGTSVQFNCTSERAYPIPTFEWYKNDQLVQRYARERERERKQEKKETHKQKKNESHYSIDRIE
jgi:hypothetical protein